MIRVHHNLVHRWPLARNEAQRSTLPRYLSPEAELSEIRKRAVHATTSRRNCNGCVSVRYGAVRMSFPVAIWNKGQRETTQKAKRELEKNLTSRAVHSIISSVATSTIAQGIALEDRLRM